MRTIIATACTLADFFGPRRALRLEDFSEEEIILMSTANMPADLEPLDAELEGWTELGSAR